MKPSMRAKLDHLDTRLAELNSLLTTEESTKDMDNYRKLTGHGWPGFSGLSAFSQDKGQRACVAAFVEAVKSGGPAPIDPAEILEVSRLAIEAAERAG